MSLCAVDQARTIRMGDLLACRPGVLLRGFLILILGAITSLILVLLAAKPLWAKPILASWHGPSFEETTTASGEVFDASGYTAASPTLPLSTKLIVTYEGRPVLVRRTIAVPSLRPT